MSKVSEKEMTDITADIDRVIVAIAESISSLDTPEVKHEFTLKEMASIRSSLSEAHEIIIALRSVMPKITEQGYFRFLTEITLAVARGPQAMADSSQLLMMRRRLDESGIISALKEKFEKEQALEEKKGAIIQ